MIRIDEPGWVEIGRRCTAGRRSTWARVERDPRNSQIVTQVELCAGREGEDAYACITPDNPAFAGLADVVTAAIFAVAT